MKFAIEIYGPVQTWFVQSGEEDDGEGESLERTPQLEFASIYETADIANSVVDGLVTRFPANSFRVVDV